MAKIVREPDDYSYEEDNYEAILIDMYAVELGELEGGAFESHSGFSDDYQNIKKLIKAIDEVVLREEAIGKEKREKAKIESENSTNENDWFIYDDVSDGTHYYFSYRQYTYKSLLFLVHTIFENRVAELCKIIHGYKGNKVINNEEILLPELDANFKEYINYIESHLGKGVINKCLVDRKYFNEIRKRTSP